MFIKYLFVLAVILSIAETKLVQVVSLFRHGARYHLNDYYDGNSTKPFWGELTAVGMRQHQTFGQRLRKDYIQSLSFLSDSYKHGEIEVITTDVNRTF
jgi:hypothetical protein